MKDSTVRTIRTAVQTLFLVAASIPVLLPSLGVDTTVGYGASLVAAAAIVSRVHAIPGVSDFLYRYLKIPK